MSEVEGNTRAKKPISLKTKLRRKTDECKIGNATRPLVVAVPHKRQFWA